MRKLTSVRLSVVVGLLGLSLLAASGLAWASTTYVQPISFTWNEAVLDVLIVPPDHGQLYNSYGVLGGEPGDLRELDPYQNSYLRAIEQSVADWDRAVATYGAPWLQSGLVTNAYVVGRDTIPEEALTDPEIAIVTDQTQVASLGFANSSSVDETRVCLVDNSKFFRASLSETDMYNVNGQEYGHCLGLEHATGTPEDSVVTHDVMYSPYSTNHDPGAVANDRHCMSNLNVRGLESVFGGLFGQPGGDSVSMEPSSYQRMSCAPSSRDVPPSRGSANLELVAHIPGAGGTDIEFFTRELTEWRDATGTVHTVPEGEPPVTRHFAMVGNRLAPTGSGAGPMSGGAKIVDITDPEAPFIAGAVQDCWADQGDIQIAAGGMLAGIAKQGGTCRLPSGGSLPNGSIMVDISNVYEPTIVGVAAHTRAHNNTFHPSGRYVYISSSGQSPNTVPIFDVSDPSAPVKVTNLTFPSGDSPHDIRFSEDGTRAYLAGIDQFRIIDTTDPENPSLISTFTAPGSTIGHDALVTPDKAFLILGDELNGGGTAPCPGGALYVYDIRGANETSPVLVGVIEAGAGPVTGRNNDEVGVNPVSTSGCTSHVIDLNPDKKSFTIAWYQAGTRTFDFSGLYDASGAPNPQPSFAWGAYGVGPVKETGWIVPEGGNTWSAKQYSGVPGYIFSDDLVMGFYVTKIKSS